MNFKEELKNILKNDPLNLLNIKTPDKIITSDQRLKNSFLDIIDFYKKNNRLPKENNDIIERKLSVRLKEIKKNPNKVKYLKQFDNYNLLGEHKEIKNAQDIFDNDYLGILDVNSEEDIFAINNFSKPKDKPDFVARRKKCINFKDYENLFKSIQNDLRSNKRKLITFKDMDLKKGGYYVLDGMIVYLENVDLKIRVLNDKTQGKRSREDGRTRCIFENGTESNMYLRSLQKQLYNNGKTITNNIEEDYKIFNNNLGQISDADKNMGNIYILSSLSNKSEIKNIKNLYKIGYCTTAVEDRVRGAENDPTFLMSNVKIVSTYEVYNLNPQKFEKLIHTIFRKRQLNIKINDQNGKMKNPKEWYCVPLRVIQRSIELINSGDIINYIYDTKLEDLVLKEKL